MIALEGFTCHTTTLVGRSYDVYRRGSGPGVIVLPEVPGITPPVARFASAVAARGFTVLVPSLFGTPGRPSTKAYAWAGFARLCVSREFAILAAERSSPVVDFLRALAREAHAELGGPGVGAIGMCMTGNFALAMMVEDVVCAPVLSQPSLPGGLGGKARAALHVSPADLAVVKRRAAGGERVLGLRFTGDPLCRKERFDRLRTELGDAFEAIEIDSSPGNSHGIPRSAHSVLTEGLVDEAGHPTRVALDRVLSFFEERLLERSG